MDEVWPGPRRPEPTRQPGGVLVVGSITADLTAFSGRLPERGETVLGEAFTLVLGGKGANQAVAAGRAGAAVRMVGRVGDDVFGDLVTRGLADAGVDTEHVRSVPGPTGIAHIRVDASGENDIVMVPLANTALSVVHIDEAFAAASSASSVLLTQLEIPIDLTIHAVRRARDAGLTVVLDPAPAHDLDPAIWSLVDVVTPNETEAALLTGIAVTDVEDAVRAARWFVERGTRHAVVTLGGAGAVLVSAAGADDVADGAGAGRSVDGSVVRTVAPFRVDAVDTTAAGDAFTGYLGAALADGVPLVDAVELAAAAGALAVTRRGASPSLPDRDDVDRLLRSTHPIPDGEVTS